MFCVRAVEKCGQTVLWCLFSVIDEFLLCFDLFWGRILLLLLYSLGKVKPNHSLSTPVTITGMVIWWDGFTIMTEHSPVFFHWTFTPITRGDQGLLDDAYALLAYLFTECSNPKKCRARFGLDQQSQWCKPCRWVLNWPCVEVVSSGVILNTSTTVCFYFLCTRN